MMSYNPDYLEVYDGAIPGMGAFRAATYVKAWRTSLLAFSASDLRLDVEKLERSHETREVDCDVER